MIQRCLSAIVTSRVMRAVMVATLISSPLAGLSAAGAKSSGNGDVVRVRLGGDLNQTRIVIELDKSVAGKLVTREDDDDKTIIALPNIDLDSSMSGEGRGIVSGWKLENVAGSVRLRLDHKADGRVFRRFLLPPADGVSVYRYVIDIVPKAASVNAATPPRSVATAPAIRTEAVSRGPTKKVVVIDAGHGGKDPGAPGRFSSEKDINLTAALALRDALERTGRYKVIMIRDNDTFVDLPGRVRMARTANADLFISLHSNSASNTEARGVSIYTLSDSGTERAARNAMTRGDWALSDPPSDAIVNRILIDLTQRATRNRSATFAQLVLDQIGESAEVQKTGLREAGFVVLLAPDVPAVLLEMGFITNTQDEKLLNDKAYINRMMVGVTRAIDKYFDNDVRYAAFAALP